MAHRDRSDDESATTGDDPAGLGNVYDPRNGAEPFRLQTLTLPIAPFGPPRTNYFTIAWIAKGSGDFWANDAQHPFLPDQLLFFVPYQHIRFEPSDSAEVTLIHFHANFLCVETFHAETGCAGTLFNDPYGSPAVTLDRRAQADVAELLSRMQHEQMERQAAYQEASLACMRLLLIVAARLKSSQSAACAVGVTDFRHPLLGPLRELIEKHYRKLHSPSDYADMLHVTAKTLGRCVRENLGKTLTDLIRERILTHAKWQLLHTLKPIKEVAVEVGFHDELYFSRLFKKATGVSPTFFREFETEIRGGSNLSMPVAQAPILMPPGTTDDS